MITSPRFNQIKAQVAAVQRKKSDARVIGIRTPGHWTGPIEQHDGKRVYRIYQCDSPLAFRLALREEQATDHVKVLLTNLEDRQLSDDILVRLTRQRLFPLDKWQTVSSLFQATAVDSRLTQHPWIADLLLEMLPPESIPPARGGFLDAEFVWSLLLKHSVGLGGEPPDLTDILKWSIDPENVRRWQNTATEFRSAAIKWLVDQVGSTAEPVLQCVSRLETPDALPIGLTLGVIYNSAAAGRLERSKGRFEAQFLAGAALKEKDIGRWHSAAGEVVKMQLADARIKSRQLQRADEILRVVQAESFAWLSDSSPLAFEQRLEKFGQQLIELLESRQPAAALESLVQARDAVLRHDMGSVRNSRRMQRVDMAMRLARWLSQQPSPNSASPSSLGEAARQHASDGAYVDWARLTLRAWDGVRALAEANSRLFNAVTDLREQQAQQFARLLADWTAAGSRSPDVVPVENVLDQIVASLAEHAPMLLVVIDGMSMAVCQELLADLTQHQWTLLSEPGRSSTRPGIATIPSVTKYARASLLSGRLQEGTSADERAAFATHSGLIAQCRAGYPPILFHKAGLQDSQEPQLTPDVRDEITSERRRIVGVVVNAVDDFLLKGEQLDVRWSHEEIKVLPALLEAARMARRLVVIVADHGHVLDSDRTVSINHPDAVQAHGTQGVESNADPMSGRDRGERWRGADSPPSDAEVLVQGPRVLAPGNRLIAPWSERMRYGSKRNGYHGGLNPQEMVVPIVVLCPTEDFPAGWQESPVQTPGWWDEPRAEQPLPEVALQDVVSPAAAERSLFDRELQEELSDTVERVEPPATVPITDTAVVTASQIPAQVPAWVSRLLVSEVFHQQKRFGGRSVPDDDVFQKLLSELDQRGGTITAAALSRAIQYPPIRLRGLLAVAQRVLNVDGYAVLSRDDASDTIILNRELLLKQFEICQ